MKRASFFIFFIFLFSVASAASVNVNVRDIISSEFKETSGVSEGLLFTDSELYNSGSVPYSARLKMSVYNGSDEVFSGWSARRDMMPGDRKLFSIYAYAGAPGAYAVKISGHYANDAFFLKEYNMTVSEFSPPTRAIYVSEPRIYKDKITLEIKPEENEGGVVVLPVGYPKTWIFEQREIPLLSKGKSVRLTLHYTPDVFMEKQVRIIAVSKDGRAFGSIPVLMKPQAGISKHLSAVLDWLEGTI